MSLYTIVRNSANINLYSGGFWNFVAGPNRTFCASDCQDNAATYENNTKLFSYGVSTINVANLILESGVGGDKFRQAAPHAVNSGPPHDGFSTAVMAAYLRQSS